MGANPRDLHQFQLSDPQNTDPGFPTAPQVQYQGSDLQVDMELGDGLEAKPRFGELPRIVGSWVSSPQLFEWSKPLQKSHVNHWGELTHLLSEMSHQAYCVKSVVCLNLA